MRGLKLTHYALVASLDNATETLYKDPERGSVMRRAVTLIVYALVVILSACSTSTPAPAASTSPALPVASSGDPSPSGVPLPGDVGPLGGLQWPAPAIAPGTLLHDDMQHLYSVPLSGGQPSVLWSHPKADVYRFAASPYGKELALAVGAKSKSVDSTIIYLLGADGAVTTVRKTPGSWGVGSLIFVRAPTELKGPVRLYWTETLGGSTYESGTGTLLMRVMTYDGSVVQRVNVPMMWGQSPLYLDAYPGDSTSTLIAYLAHESSQFLVLRNNDQASAATLASPTTWGSWAPVTITDVGTQVAWLSPSEYVVGYGNDGDPINPTFALKRFRVGCEWRGSDTFWSGSGLDAGLLDSRRWNMLAPDADHVLMLGSGYPISGPTPWLSVDVNTGTVTRTSAMWTPEEPGRSCGAPRSRPAGTHPAAASSGPGPERDREVTD